MMEMPPGAGGARPGWLGYIGVDDVDAHAKEVTETGGTLHHGPQDIPGIGRFAVVGDPQGTVFALFKPGEGPQGEPLAPKTPGRAGWHELHAVDGAAAFDYYAKLFGWTKGDGLDMGPIGIYQIFNHDGIMAGGIFTKPAAEPVALLALLFQCRGHQRGRRTRQSGGRADPQRSA